MTEISTINKLIVDEANEAQAQGKMEAPAEYKPTLADMFTMVYA